MSELEGKKGTNQHRPPSRTLSQRFLRSGEIYELKAELNSDKRERRKEAVKKVRCP